MGWHEMEWDGIVVRVTCGVGEVVLEDVIRGFRGEREMAFCGRFWNTGIHFTGYGRDLFLALRIAMGASHQELNFEI